jgi:hypothetical protein
MAESGRPTADRHPKMEQLRSECLSSLSQRIMVASPSSQNASPPSPTLYSLVSSLRPDFQLLYSIARSIPTSLRSPLSWYCGIGMQWVFVVEVGREDRSRWLVGRDGTVIPERNYWLKTWTAACGRRRQPKVKIGPEITHVVCLRACIHIFVNSCHMHLCNPCLCNLLVCVHVHVCMYVCMCVCVCVCVWWYSCNQFAFSVIPNPSFVRLHAHNPYCNSPITSLSNCSGNRVSYASRG